MPSIQTPASPDAPLTTDLLCVQCDYNLRTKRPSELCPECGKPVADSVGYISLFVGTRMLLFAAGALLIALQPLWVFMAMHAYDYFPGRRQLHIAMIISQVGMLLSGTTILLATALLIRGMNPSHRPNLLATAFFFALASFYTMIEFGPAPHFLRMSTDRMWRWDLLIGTAHSANIVALILAAGTFMLRFGRRYVCPRLELVTRIVLAITCFIGLYRCLLWSAALAFNLGDTTVAPLLLVFDGQIRSFIGDTFEIAFATIQVLYWTGVAILAFRLHRFARRAIPIHLHLPGN